jgi:hypothetical protein
LIFIRLTEEKIHFIKKGPVAEWLGTALQKLLQQFESARDLPQRKRPVSKMLTGLLNLITMVAKYLYWIGLAACITLIASCFLPWAYFDDIHQTFTGFYSYHNQYGRPGKFLTVIGFLVFVGMLLPKIWAKRANLFVAALGVGYAIKTYILYVSCYNAYCPERKLGIYLMIVSTIVMMIATAFPDMKLTGKAVAKTTT